MNEKQIILVPTQRVAKEVTTSHQQSSAISRLFYIHFGGNIELKQSNQQNPIIITHSVNCFPDTEERLNSAQCWKNSEQIETYFNIKNINVDHKSPQAATHFMS